MSSFMFHDSDVTVLRSLLEDARGYNLVPEHMLSDLYAAADALISDYLQMLCAFEDTDEQLSEFQSPSYETALAQQVRAEHDAHHLDPWVACSNPVCRFTARYGWDAA